MSTDHRVAMLGTGLIGDFYTMTLHGRRSRDRVEVVYSRSVERGEAFGSAGACRTRRRASRRRSTHPDVDTVVVGLPNHMHEEAIAAAAAAGKAVLCTKPLARNGRRGEADPRRRRVGGRLRRLPRGPRLHAEDAEGAGIGARRGDRRRDVGAQPGDPPRSAQRLVLGRRPGRRRVHRRPRLPLHRDHPQLRRQGQPSGRGDVLERHARPPDRRRGQRHRPDPLRERRDRPVRGELDVPRRHGPARRGRRHGGHDLDQPLPAHRLRDVLRRRRAATSPRRPRPRAAGCSRSATRSPSSATSTCSPTCSTPSTRDASRSRRSTTATSSTP